MRKCVTTMQEQESAGMARNVDISMKQHQQENYQAFGRKRKEETKKTRNIACILKNQEGANME